MKNFLHWVLWCLEIILGCALFALGFDLFLAPHNINAGGLSGLAMIIVHLTKWGSVALVSLLINIPLFLIGGLRIGKKFFFGSLIGTAALSGFLELFLALPAFPTEPLLGAVFGGVFCGAGAGLVFLAGASTGGSDIIVRLLKKRWKHIPIGKIVLGFDSAVMLLTGIAFQDVSNILYCAITLYLCSKVVDAVVYSFDYSKVALIVSGQYEAIAKAIGDQLGRGVTYLYGQGSYSGKDTKVILTAVKKQQLADLKEIVVSIDPDAFVILQESHQVLGDGFARYTSDSL